MAVIKRAIIFLLDFLLGGAAATFLLSFLLVSMSVPAGESAPITGTVFLVFGFGSGVLATKKWG
jgi:hypothetical protein